MNSKLAKYKKITSIKIIVKTLESQREIFKNKKTTYQIKGITIRLKLTAHLSSEIMEARGSGMIQKTC